MSYITNGDYRQSQLIVKVTTNGVPSDHTFSMLDSFESVANGKVYPALTAVEFQHIEQNVYLERLDYFIRYVELQVEGFKYAGTILNKAYGSTMEADAPEGLVCANMLAN